MATTGVPATPGEAWTHGHVAGEWAEPDRVRGGTIRLDLYYVDNWSMLNDLAIIAKTVPTVLRRQGAY